MEGRVLLTCVECDLKREIVGEIPEEYTRSFDDAVHRDGWVPRPGASSASLICGECLVKSYAGHETVDDEEKVQGRKTRSSRSGVECGSVSLARLSDLVQQ